MRPIHNLALLLAALLCTPLQAVAAALSDSTLDRTIEAKMREAGMVGIAAAILVDKRVVWMQGYGFADRQRGVAFTPDTVMNIGSISKTVTGAALMRAVQDGVLSLDEDINTYLPFKVVNPHRPDARITLRQIATHTSGITDRWAAYERAYHFGGDAPQALGQFLQDYLVPAGDQYATENFLDVAPGTFREYSNIAAALAGYIVERAVGEPLDGYTRRTIFAPLGMRRSGWLLAGIDPATHATLYAAQNGFSIPIQPYGLATYPDGGVRTSVADLSRFFIALLNAGELDGMRILSRDSAREMLRFQFTADNAPMNAPVTDKNSGIFWASKFDVTRMGHGGADPGVRTDMLADLSGDVGVILFCNTSLDERAAPAYEAIFTALWDRAVALEAQAR